MTAYKANFTKTSLIVPESRVVADLLLREVTHEEWKHEIFDKNVLQKRTRETALTYASIARSRLETMGPGLWELVRDGTLPVATHAMLAATVKFSPLLGDFMHNILQDQYRQFKSHLDSSLWSQYIENCRNQDVEMSEWSDSTCSKLRQNAMRILACIPSEHMGPKWSKY